jgi:hypothetical protein
MHRVLSEHEVVGMRSRRPKNELRIGLRMEVDRVMRRLEDRKLPGFHILRDTNAARARRDPANRMVDGRLVAPGLASSQAHRQIVQRGRKIERARRPAVGSDQNTRRAVARDGVRCQVGPRELLITTANPWDTASSRSGSKCVPLRSARWSLPYEVASVPPLLAAQRFIVRRPVI